jgi:hypothetical protein
MRKHGVLPATLVIALATCTSGIALADGDFFPWWDAPAAPDALAGKCKGKTVTCGKTQMCGDTDWACCYQLKPCQLPKVCCDGDCKEKEQCVCLGDGCPCKPSKTCENKCDIAIWNGCENITCKCKPGEEVCFKGTCCAPKKCKINQCGTPGDGCGGRLNCGFNCPPKKRCNVQKYICEPIPGVQ